MIKNYNNKMKKYKNYKIKINNLKLILLINLRYVINIKNNI